MQRQHNRRRQSGSRRAAPSPAAQLWNELLRPALLIALTGFCAVLYISACARVSIMEWDLYTLQQRSSEMRDQCLALQREIAEACKSSLIRDHVAEHHLTRGSQTAEVVIDSAPHELLSELIGPSDGAETDLATLGSEAAGGDALIAAAPPSP